MSDSDTTVRDDEPRPGFRANLGARALVVVLSAERFGQSRVIGREPLTVGRGKDRALRIPDPAVSAEHCGIHAVDGGGYSIEDSGSTNGTFVNGRRIGGPVSLHYGDRITIGSTILRFFIEEKPEPTAG
jgi:pSer/pThr/pTyr-binding forkhead associated (FHA) protein